MDEMRIMAVAEIALALGVSPGRTHALIKDDPTFPKPAVELSVGRIWRTDDIEAWAKLKGYPRKKAGAA
jgi:predicted DNA-binding transcriptional regulator AlpA